MYKQSFRLAFEGEMVVTNTTFELEKFLINVFPPKDFLNQFAWQLIDKASCGLKKPHEALLL